MRQFKKRTLALVLASVITVAGSFASERYKNTLKALTFENKGNGIINMVVQTGSAYSGNVTPIKRGADKYVLMLPEVDANSVQSDFRNVSSDIIGVETNTLPYTTNSNGYTKIVVYTKANVNLVGENRIFIPSADEKKLISNNNHSERKVEQPQRYKQPQETNESVSEPVEEDYQEETQEEYSEQPLVEDNISQEESIQDSASQVYEEPNKNDPYESYILFLSAFLILLLCIFIYKHSLSKMQEIAGESIDFSEDSENKKKEKKSKQIRSTIKNLDSKYSRPTGMPKTSEYTVSESKPVVEEIPEIANVVDLDEIFKETKKAKEEVTQNEDDENAALEDFLSGFSFMDEEEIEEEAVEQGPGYDAELYEKIISSALVEFTQRDMDCISKLLSSEIDDNTLKNIKDYAVSNPIKKGPTKTQILEELVTTYSISQNISFTQDDIGILNKLISVEIDSDFITNLKTDPERTKQMYKEIQEAKNIKRKTSEDLTLNVKDMLPDLSVELRKQGDAEIECAVKPVTVFYSEGYDVSKLAITDVLPDLSAEINKKDAYVSKPSAEYQIVDNSYEVERMAINFDLPDLEDVMANPEKYADPEPEKVIVDEEALLKNISNVEFKPFYDGTENFEVLNDIEEVEAIKKREAEELAALFIDLDKVNFKEDEPFEQNDEFQEFYEDEKAEELVIQEIKEEPKEEIVKLERSVKPASPRRERESQNIDLLQKIEQRRQERKSQNKVLETLRENKQKESTLKEERQSDIKCILEGKSYLVVSSVELGENIGCHLAENEDSFAVLSYTGNNLVKIKEYKELKSKKIQARLSETLENGVSRYIVRIGINKFVLDVQDKNIKFVMDLC